MTPKKPLWAQVVAALEPKQLGAVLVAFASLGGCFHNRAQIGVEARVDEAQRQQIAATQLAVAGLSKQLAAATARLKRVERAQARAGDGRGTASRRVQVGPLEPRPGPVRRFWSWLSSAKPQPKSKWSPPTGPGPR